MGEESPWKPFANIQGGCGSCPPSQRDPFRKRVQGRARLIRQEANFGKMPFFATGLAITLECFFMGWKMSGGQLARAVVFVILVGVVVAIPVVIYELTDTDRSVAIDVLFNVLLTFAGAVVAFTLQQPAAERRARKQWLPFAESACVDLVTIGAEAERMRRVQRSYCGSIRSLLPEEQVEQLAPIVALVDQHCQGAAEKLVSVRDRLGKARRDWEGFIRNHCDGPECEVIDSRIAEVELELYETMNKEVPLPKCYDGERAAPIDTAVPDVAPE